MKRIGTACLLILFISCVYGQSYQPSLKKLNDYLKTFDNGYYGYMEVKDGYLIEHFKSGNYCKASMKDLEGGIDQPQYNRVILGCKDNKKCIYSTWNTTSPYDEYIQFTTSGTFNRQELVDLLNNFIGAYNNKSNNTSTTKTSTGKNYVDALKKLNDYLITFDGDRYQGMEIKDGYIYNHYKNGNYSNAKIEDIDTAIINSTYGNIKLTCKDNKSCIYSTITKSYHEYFNFQSTTVKDLTVLAGLLNDFMSALKNKQSTKSTSTSTSGTNRNEAAKQRQEKKGTDDTDDFFGLLLDMPNTSETPVKEEVSAKTSNTDPAKYSKALKDINDYLKIFNPEVYDRIEVKDGKVYFYFRVFSAVYNSFIDINDLTKNTTVFNLDKEVKILCKGDAKYFYSTYSKGNVDHFRFYANGIADFNKMRKLVDDFIKALQ